MLVILIAFSFSARAQPAPKYEMAKYFVVFLNKGPRWTAEETPDTRKIQEGHMANIRKMAATGKLVVAGPFTDGGTLRGMFVFASGSAEETMALVNADPAIRAGRLEAEIHPWLAAKGLNVPLPK